MTAIQKSLSVLGLCIALSGGAVVATSCGGCSSWRSATHKTVGTVVITSDAAMKTWAAYVHAGKATTNQEAQVKAAYEKYQAAMNTVIDAAKSATTSTNKAAMDVVINLATVAQGNLVNLITTLTAKPK